MSFLKGFKYAFCGIIHCIKNERNMRVHTVAALYVLLFARFFDFGRTEYVLLLLTIGGVLAAEAINTAVETLCDKVCREKDAKIKAAKDAAAGAVLILASFAAVIGVVMFSQPEGWVRAYEYYISHIPGLCIMGAVTVLSLVYIIFPFGKKKERGKNK